MKNRNWIREFSVAEDGFYGHLYRPEKDVYPNKAVLVLGGSGVPYEATLIEAEAFAEMGITALAVGYFGVKDTPKSIVRVPIEFVEKAADRLHSMDVKTVIAVGISKGAELALVSASLLPQINAVIAFSPSARVNMGIGTGIEWVNASSWTFRGEELPYAYAKASGVRAMWNSLRARELTFRPVYEQANRSAPSDTLIPVEKIRGPILLAAAEHDSLWPSAEACAEITSRLDSHGFAYPHKQLIYRCASHLLLPFETNYARYFRVGRQFPAECKASVQELRREVQEFLNDAGTPEFDKRK